MSTYWYLECTSHTPPIKSDDITQHTNYRLDHVRSLWANRHKLIDLQNFVEQNNLGDYEPLWGDNDAHEAWWFIRQHPDCTVRFRSEYGDVQPIELAAAVAGAGQEGQPDA